jgi:hypothetical protein
VKNNSKTIVSFMIIHVLALNDLAPFLFWRRTDKIIVLI